MSLVYERGKNGSTMIVPTDIANLMGSVAAAVAALPLKEVNAGVARHENPPGHTCRVQGAGVEVAACRTIASSKSPMASSRASFA